MVASTIHLPNLRKMFIPDPGYIIIECDLKQADAQFVAWEADDPILKDVFRRRLDLHIENAKLIYGLDEYDPEKHAPLRQKAKVACHAANYLVGRKKLASVLGTNEAGADTFLRTWFRLHPGIKEWHERIKENLDRTRTISNPFGFRKFFFERKQKALTEAVAWVPQSGVAIVTNKAWERIDDDLYPDVQVLLQVHDSLLMQVPESKFHALAPEIHRRMHITVPYDDPLIIPIDMKASDKSWGDCSKDFDPIVKELNSSFLTV